MTVALHNRRKLEVAMRWLLDGTVTPPDTKLTWKNVAMVAGVSKATADRAIDLRDEFRRQIEERVPPPTIRTQPSSRSRANAEEELARLRRDNAELKESAKVLHTVILAVTQQNQRLARRHRRNNADVVPLHGPRQAPNAEALMDCHAFCKVDSAELGCLDQGSMSCKPINLRLAASHMVVFP